MEPRNSDAGGEGGPPYRFDEIVVDPAAHTVLRAGVPQPLEPKAFAVLLALLHHPGELIGRDDLLDAVWGHRHVTPGVLTRAIAQLRHALGDDPHQPRYIQTRHALGYCFIGTLHTEAARLEHAVADTTGDATAGTEVVATLEAAAPAPPTAPEANAEPAPPALEVPVSSAPASRRWRVPAVLLLALLGLALWALRGARSPVAPVEASIAVLPFSHPGTDRGDDYFTAGLADEMRDALAGVNGLKVAAAVSPASLRDAPDARALGKRLGVATLLDASVRREGTRLRVTARLTDTATGFLLWSHAYEQEVSDVFDIQGEVGADVVRSLLGSRPEEMARLKRRLAPTRSEAAFDAYLQGLRLLHDAAQPADADAAIARFDQALARDSGFARAQAKICRTEIWRFQNGRSADAFARARTACQRATAMDPQLGEVELALGDLERARGDLDQAMTHYRKSAQSPAVGAASHVGMARVYAAQGKPKQALAQFREALALSPADAHVYAEIGYQQYFDGDVPQALASYRQVVALTPDDAQSWSTLGALSLEAGDNAAAAQALQHAIAISPDAASLTNLGQLKYQAGDYAAAVDLQRRAVRLAPQDFMMWANLGEALDADPANALAAHDAYREAATRASQYLAVKPDDARAYAALGVYRAILGDPAAARALVQRSEALGSQPGEVALLNAQTLVLLGQPDAARMRLARARAAGIAESLITSNLILRRAGLLSPPAGAARPASAESPTPRSGAGPSPGE